MSKGSWKRPMAVSHETYSRNYDRIFGKPKSRPKGPGLSLKCPFCSSWDTTPPSGGSRVWHCETCHGFFTGSEP